MCFEEMPGLRGIVRQAAVGAVDKVGQAGGPARVAAQALHGEGGQAALCRAITQSEGATRLPLTPV